MLSFILSILLPLQAGLSPEEMYQDYITPETQAILEQYEQVDREAKAAEEARQRRKTLALAVSIVIGLIPLGSVGRQVIKGKTWKQNPGGTISGLAIALLGGGVMFALTYGVIRLKIEMGSGFNTLFAFLLVGALIAGAIFLLTKKGDIQ